MVHSQQVFPYGLHGDVGGSVVFLMWRPRVTAFYQSAVTISWDVLSIRHTGKVVKQGCWEGVRLQGH